MSQPSLFRRSLWLWPILLLTAACRDDEVAAYRVPKEKPSVATVAASADGPGADPHAAAAPAAMAATNVATASGNALAWTAPASWTSKPGSAMRKGSYAVNGANGASADLAITAFPGDVGGEIANVNRWRGQVQLAPLSEPEAAAAVTRLEVHGLRIGLVDFTGGGEAGTRLVGAMVPFEGNTWFFKLLGPAPVVGEARAAFVEFLQTLRPTAP